MFHLDDNCVQLCHKQTNTKLSKQIKNNLNNWVWELVIMFHIDDDSARLCALIGLNLLEILIRENEWERGDTSNVLRCQWKYFVYCYNCMFTLCCVRFLWRCKCNCETAWVQTSSVLNCDVKLTTLCHLILTVTLTIIISTESCATSGYRCYCGYHAVIICNKSAYVQMQIMNFAFSIQFILLHSFNTLCL